MAMDVPIIDYGGDHEVCVVGTLKEFCPTFIGKRKMTPIQGPAIPD